MKINLDKNKAFCIAPFVSQSHDYSRNTFALCCSGKHEKVNEETRKALSMDPNKPTDVRALEIWNGSYMNDVRAKMLKGEYIKGCEKCYKNESVGDTSDRKEMWDRDFFVDPVTNNNDKPLNSPMHIELWAGKLCNLKCRMCSSDFSDLWQREIEKFRYKKHPPRFQEVIDDLMWGEVDEHTVKNLPQYFQGSKLKDEHLNELVRTLAPPYIDFKLESITPFVKDLREIRLLGGEPTLLDEVTKFLDYCIETDNAKHIGIDLITNGTKLTTKYINKLLKFERVQIELSQDGVYDTLEYIRTPLRHKTIEKATKLCVDAQMQNLDKLTYNAIYSSQIYNIENLPQMIEWQYDRASPIWTIADNLTDWPPTIGGPLQFETVHFPECLKIEILDDKTRKYLYDNVHKTLDKLFKTEEHKEFYIELTWLKLILNKLAGKGEDVPDYDYVDTGVITPASHKRLREEFRIYTNILDNRRSSDFAEISPLVAKAVNYTKIKY